MESFYSILIRAVNFLKNTALVVSLENGLKIEDPGSRGISWRAGPSSLLHSRDRGEEIVTDSTDGTSAILLVVIVL